MFIVKLFYALFGIAIGLGILKYRKVVYSWTGKFYWAEKYLGSWGTVFVICLVWLGFIFVSVGYPFWVYDKTPRGDTETSQTQTNQDTGQSNTE